MFFGRNRVGHSRRMPVRVASPGPEFGAPGRGASSMRRSRSRVKAIRDACARATATASKPTVRRVAAPVDFLLARCPDRLGRGESLKSGRCRRWCDLTLLYLVNEVAGHPLCQINLPHPLAKFSESFIGVAIRVLRV